jgi:hypothetical protein
MEAVLVALIVAAAGIITPLLVIRMQNRRLDDIAKVAADTLAKVATVEILADGSLTAAYRAELAAVEAQGIAMRKPSSDTQAAINAIEARLTVMRRALADREAAIGAAHQLIANGAALPDDQRDLG